MNNLKPFYADPISRLMRRLERKFNIVDRVDSGDIIMIYASTASGSISIEVNKDDVNSINTWIMLFES